MSIQYPALGFEPTPTRAVSTQNHKTRAPAQKVRLLPAFEILTFSSAATWTQDYLVTDSSDWAFLLGQECEIEYFVASSENHGFDHLKQIKYTL